MASFTLFRGLSALVSGRTNVPRMKYLSQSEAIAVDEELFKYFSVDSLMELAGLSVAAAIRDAYPPKGQRVLICAGPGNNGGDGLVAARHLKFFGYEPMVLYPKQSEKLLFRQLVSQMELMRIQVIDAIPMTEQYDLILDCVFGFSFSGGKPRAPFDQILNEMTNSKKPIISVDIPSGWHVEQGPPDTDAIQPSILISLTAPKHCAIYFDGPHYLGLNVPFKIQQKFGFRQPRFQQAEQFLRLDTLSPDDEILFHHKTEESLGGFGTSDDDDDDVTTIEVEVASPKLKEQTKPPSDSTTYF